jgi:hypothetical protein
VLCQQEEFSCIFFFTRLSRVAGRSAAGMRRGMQQGTCKRGKCNKRWLRLRMSRRVDKLYQHKSSGKHRNSSPPCRQLQKQLQQQQRWQWGQSGSNEQGIALSAGWL